MPAFVPVHLLAVAAAGQLGRPSETRITLDTFTRAFPTLRTAERARAEWGAIFWDGPLVDHLVAGVEQALALSGALTPSITSSTTAAVADRFAIGVRPLRPAGGNAAETLADGLTDAIVTRISRFSYLRVARSRATDSDIRKSGYFLDGNVRVVGRNVRVTVDLTAADTQTSVWSQAYDRQIGDEGFALQDALGDTIVATIADANGALVRSIAAAVQAKPIADLTPYEAVLRRFVYINQLSEEEHAVVRECLEAAVEQAPAYADAWACLAYVYSHEESTSFNTRPNALDRALAAAQRALQLEAANPLGYQSLAIVQYFRRDLAAFRAAAERAMALNPLDCYTLCIHGVFTAYAGDWEQGLALAARARALNPDHPGIYWAPDCVDRFRRRDYAGALELVERINTPRYPPYVILKAAVYGQLGRVDEARAVWEQGVGGSPAARWIDIFDKWFSPELASHAREGLLKAGIEA
jgi:TolB-like protein